MIRSFAGPRTPGFTPVGTTHTIGTTIHGITAVTIDIEIMLVEESMVPLAHLGRQEA
jgi:hypothetical protein